MISKWLFDHAVSSNTWDEWRLIYRIGEKTTAKCGKIWVSENLESACASDIIMFGEVPDDQLTKIDNGPYPSWNQKLWHEYWENFAVVDTGEDNYEHQMWADSFTPLGIIVNAWGDGEEFSCIITPGVTHVKGRYFDITNAITDVKTKEDDEESSYSIFEVLVELPDYFLTFEVACDTGDAVDIVSDLVSTNYPTFHIGGYSEIGRTNVKYTNIKRVTCARCEP
jgi:hypothetical protein